MLSSSSWAKGKTGGLAQGLNRAFERVELHYANSLRKSIGQGNISGVIGRVVWPYGACWHDADRVCTKEDRNNFFISMQSEQGASFVMLEI